MIINKYTCDIKGCETKVEIAYTPDQLKTFEDGGWQHVPTGDTRYGSLMDGLHFCPTHELKDYHRRSGND